MESTDGFEVCLSGFKNKQPSMRVWDRKIEDRKRGMGRRGCAHVPKLPALIFLSPIFLFRMDVVSIQGPGFSGPQNGGKASFGSQPDQRGFDESGYRR